MHAVVIPPVAGNRPAAVGALADHAAVCLPPKWRDQPVGAVLIAGDEETIAALLEHAMRPAWWRVVADIVSAKALDPIGDSLRP